MKIGEVQRVMRAFVDPDDVKEYIEEGLLEATDAYRSSFIALVDVPGDTTYEVELKALKSKLDWRYLDLKRAQLLNRTLPIEIEFEPRKDGITESSAQKWAEQVTTLLEKESGFEPTSQEEVILAPSAIAITAIEKLNEKITDEIFKIIENDSDLRKEYDLTVSHLNPKDVNRLIGRTVKVMYNLANSDDRETAPSSSLIKSHQKLKLKTE